MASTSRLYLDNAATSWPKPEAVYQAVDSYARQCGAAAGRGQSDASSQADQLVEQARSRLAQLLGGVNADSILFGFNGTDVLNQAIFGLLRPGDHVITTVLEHNSVLRPLRQLQDHLQIQVSYVDCNEQWQVEPHSIVEAIRPETRMVVMTHASNVTGRVQPIEQIGERLREFNQIAFLVDGCQTSGHMRIDLANLPVDLFASSGHKGLLGPLGTGLLYVGRNWLDSLVPFRFGGTGLNSDEEIPPTSSPARFEAGNQNVGGLAGLAAAAEFLQNETLAAIESHERLLVERIVEGLERIDQVRLVGDFKDLSSDSGSQCGVVSFLVGEEDPRESAVILDQAFEIQLRAGLHCAPRIHQRLRTAEQGGTLRVSPGWSTTPDDIDRFLEAIRELSQM